MEMSERREERGKLKETDGPEDLANTNTVGANIHYRVHSCKQTAAPRLHATLKRRGMASTRPLKVCGGIWHQDISSRSFKSCKMRGGASMDRTCLSSPSHRCSIGLRSGEFGMDWVRIGLPFGPDADRGPDFEKPGHSASWCLVFPRQATHPAIHMM
ncbi:hypothetical protein JZ751_024948 [Albula glossodonta]|uniref:Uncharacterized protein n=1 Tax=Albula glossodonta TaxID=121402 RepID=A0A8T2PM73_9TELE|nr:hypothetical protein JZ751_024948 [Albula glossodonta]